jgi:energy-coupling factor transporter ATP-binding protein EcfA2
LADNLDYWRRVLAVIDPQRSLREDEIEALYAPRPEAPSEQLRNQLRLAAVGFGDPEKVLMCGARGSGKTTELVRLGRLMRDDYVPIRVDLAAALPSGSGTVPLLAIFAIAGLHALHAWKAPDADLVEPRKRLDSALSALSSVGEVASGLGELVSGVAPLVTVFGVPAAASAGVAGVAMGQMGLQLQKLRDFARTLRGAELDPANIAQTRDLVETVNSLFQQLQVLTGRPALLLADGLDKQDELEDVFAALESPDLIQRIQVPVVLTGPVNLRHDPRFRGLRNHFRNEILFNVAVRKPPGDAHPAGEQVLMDLYERRRKAANLPEDLFQAEDIRRAASMSAGIVRDFLSILYDAGLEAFSEGRDLVTTQDLETGVRKLRQMMQMALNSDRIVLLGRVLKKRVLPPGMEASRLLYENYVACYPNGDVWYRPHEVLVDYVTRNQDSRG